MKYDDKTKELAAVPNLKILPILDYVDKLIEFAPKVNMSISLPPLTVVKNTIDGNVEIILTSIENLESKHL